MFDAYQVAIRLSLHDKFTSAMRLAGNAVLSTHTHVDALQTKLDKLSKTFAAGMLTTSAGFGIAMALKASTNEAVKFEQQLNRLKALNLDARLGAGTTSGLQQAAAEISKNTKGTTATEALKLVTETQSITGNVQHTLELAPVLAKLKFGMETYMAAGGKGDGHGAGSERQFMDIVKVMEMRGLMRDFTAEKLDKMADLFTKSYVASGGMVKPSDFLAMMKTGGTAGKLVGEDFMFALGHIMQEKGGNRSGTALMSNFQGMVAGRMPQQVAETLKSLGLLDANAIHYGKTGHITKVDPGGVKDYQTLMQNPLDFLEKNILPALKAKGVDTSDPMQALMKLNSLTGQRTASDMWSQLYLERDQIRNYIAQSKNAMGFSQLYAQGSGSVVGQEHDLQAKVNQLELEFGTAALPLLKSALEQAIPLVKSMGEWMSRNQNGLSMLVTGIAGLAAAMLVTGPIMVLTSSFGFLRVAMTVMGGPLGSLVGLLGGATKLGLVGAAGFAAYEVGRLIVSLYDLAGVKLRDGVVQNAATTSRLNDPETQAKLKAMDRDFVSKATPEEKRAHDEAAALRDWKHTPSKDPMEAYWRSAGLVAEPAKIGQGPSVAPKSQQVVQVNTQINLDKRKVGEAVTQHVASNLGAPMTGNSGFDGTMWLAPVGAP